MIVAAQQPFQIKKRLVPLQLVLVILVIVVVLITLLVLTLTHPSRLQHHLNGMASTSKNTTIVYQSFML